MTRAIVAIGTASAVVIYLVNVLSPDSPGFELEESKKYLRDLEVVGGKANVLATNLRHWVDGLWHGKSLAFTVAVISVLLAVAYNFFAMPMPASVDPKERSGPGTSS